MSKDRLMRGVVCVAFARAASLVPWGHAARTLAQGPPHVGDKPGVPVEDAVFEMPKQ